MKPLNRMTRRALPLLLLAAASSFGAGIGTLFEASTDPSLLIASDWGIPQGSFILSLDQLFSREGRAPIVVAAPSSTPSSSSANVTTTSASAVGGTTTTTQQQPPAPILITLPNFGFQVILNADFSIQGPDVAIVNPGKVLLVSSGFASAPVQGTALSEAGALFAGDTPGPPTLLASPVAVAPGSPIATPTASTPTATNTATTPSDPAAPTGTTATNPNAPRQQPPDPFASVDAIASVPEPSTSIGVSLALLGLGWLKYRTKRS